MRFNPVKAGVLAGLAAFALYVRTAAPSISAADSGELISAAWILGVPHQPGYPLFCLTGKAAALLPLGGVAFRINLLSALFSAATCLVLVITMVRYLRIPSLTAVGAAFLLACSRPFWGISIVTEVYSLNLLLLSLLLAALVRPRMPPGRKTAAVCFLWGLSLATHPTSILFAPALVSVAALHYRVLSPRRCLIGGGCLLLGLWVFLYLPLRAITQPEINWGLAYNVKNVLIHTCKKFSINVFQPAPWKPSKSPMMVFKIVGLSLWTLMIASPFPAILLAMVALFRRIRNSVRLSIPWLLAIGLPFIATALSFEFHEPDVMVDYGSKFFLPVFILLVLLAVETLPGRGGTSRPRTIAMAQTTLAVLALTSVLINGRYMNLRRFAVYYDYGRNLLKSLPENALVFADGDQQVFTIAFHKLVRGLRPDVRAVDQKGNMFSYFYNRGKLTIKSRNRQEADFLSDASRPVFYTERHVPFYVGGFRLRQRGIVFRAVPDTAPEPPRRGRAARSYRIRSPGNPRRTDCVTRIVLARYWTFLGNYYSHLGRIEKAVACHRRCLAIGHRTSVALTNLALNTDKAGDREKTREYLRRAIEHRDPVTKDPYLRLAALLFEAQEFRRCLDIVNEGLEHFSRSPGLHLLAGSLYAYCLPDPARAVFHWRNYLAYEPSPTGRPGAERKTVKGEIIRLQQQADLP